MQYNYLYDLEQIMKQAMVTALLVGAVVFVAGIVLGWWYGLLLAFVILLAVNLIELTRR